VVSNQLFFISDHEISRIFLFRYFSNAIVQRTRENQERKRKEDFFIHYEPNFQEETLKKRMCFSSSNWISKRNVAFIEALDHTWILTSLLRAHFYRVSLRYFIGSSRFNVRPTLRAWCLFVWQKEKTFLACNDTFSLEKPHRRLRGL